MRLLCVCVFFCSKSNQRGVHAERNGGSLERADISDMHVYVVLAYIFIYVHVYLVYN